MGSGVFGWGAVEAVSEGVHQRHRVSHFDRSADLGVGPRDPVQEGACGSLEQCGEVGIFGAEPSPRAWFDVRSGFWEFCYYYDFTVRE